MTITSEGVETIQRKCSTSTKENEVVWKARPLQVSLANQGGGIQLDCSRSRVCRIQEENVQYLYYESAYKGRGTTHVRGSGSVHRRCNDT